MRYVAENLRGNRYVVRPEGALGTCGWIKGEAWSAIFVNANSPAHALLKAYRLEVNRSNRESKTARL